MSRDTYFERNTEIVNSSDALVVFQMNRSEGSEDAVTKALGQGKTVRRFEYVIE